MATHSSILAWRIPWAEKPGGLQSMGSQRVDLACTHAPHLEERQFPCAVTISVPNIRCLLET